MNSFSIDKNDFRFKYQKSEGTGFRSASEDHLHSTFELMYFIDGDVDYMIQGKCYHLAPHDLLIIKPGENHNAINLSGGTYERFVIRFPRLMLAEEQQRKINGLKSAYNLKNSIISEEFYRFRIYDNEIDSSLRLSTFTAQLNIILNLLLSADGLEKKADWTDSRIDSMLSQINENITSIHSLDDIANLNGVSVSTVQKMFSRMLSLTPMQYVNSCKCMKARSFMEKGISAKAAYRNAGFTTYSTFFREYKKFYGTSPSFTKS